MWPRSRCSPRAWGALLFLLALAAPVSAQRFAEASRSGPFAWFSGLVLRSAVGPLTGGDWTDVAAVDWDHNGRLDLFVGSGYGDLLFFRSRPDGLFEPPAGLGSAEPDPFAFQPVRSQACPATCDWDGDGDLDLLLAAEQKLFLYASRPGPTGATFAPGVELLAEGGARLLPVPDCGITALRLTPDGLPELFISCPDGRVLRAQRKTAEVLAPPTELVPAGDLPRARTDVADFDGDGTPDLIIGTADGRAFLRRSASADGRLTFGAVTPIGSADGRVPGPDGAPLRDLSPRCVDWEGDGDADLLLGCRSGQVLLLERIGPSELVSRGYLRQLNAPIDAGRCAAADLADWDGDGRPDLIVGGEDGLLRVYPDEGHSTEGVFGEGRLVRARDRPWCEEGGYSWPAFLPRTGRPFGMVAIGGGSGCVQLLSRTEAGAVSHAEKLAAGGRTLALRQLMTVTAYDYSLDGAVDLFLGARERPGDPLESTQPVIYLQNEAGPDRPPLFTKAAQIELYTGGGATDSVLQEAGTLRPYAVSVAEWTSRRASEFIVLGAQGVDLFTAPARRNVYPTLFLAPGEGSRLLPPVYFCRATPLAGRPGLLIGTEAYGLLCWYPRRAWDDLDRATGGR